jgi:hypothetical protein
VSIFDAIGDGFKKAGQAILNGARDANRAVLNGLGHVVHVEGFSNEQLQQLPDGVTPSESWAKLSAALADAERHAQDLADDWDNQKHVAAVLEKAALQQQG